MIIREFVIVRVDRRMQLSAIMRLVGLLDHSQNNIHTLIWVVRRQARRWKIYCTGSLTPIFACISRARFYTCFPATASGQFISL
jgi:hypothetical protein